jgi:hypothetical protein
VGIFQQTDGFGICDDDLWTLQKRSCRYTVSVIKYLLYSLRVKGTKRRSRPTGKTEKHQHNCIAVWESAFECG